MRYGGKYSTYQYRPGHFQVNFTHEGKQVHLQKWPGSGNRLTSEMDAALLVAYLKERGYHPEKWGKDQTFQFDKCIQTYLKSCTASPEWVHSKKEYAERFFKPFFKHMDIRQIKEIHIQQFYATLLDKKLSQKYVKNVMGELHAFLNFYKKNLPSFPDFPKVVVQEKPIRWLTEPEQDQLFQCIPEADKPIFEFMRHYGTRINEARGLLRQNVFPGYVVIATTLRSNGEVKAHTKTNKIRILPIVAETRWLFEGNGDCDFVFCKNGKPYRHRQLVCIWEKASRLSGVKINLYNGVRHSFAMQRLNSGFPIEEVMVILGHTTSKMTQRYAQYTLKSLENIVRGNIYNSFIANPETKLLDLKGNSDSEKKAIVLFRNSAIRSGDVSTT